LNHITAQCALAAPSATIVANPHSAGFQIFHRDWIKCDNATEVVVSAKELVFDEML